MRFARDGGNFWRTLRARPNRKRCHAPPDPETPEDDRDRQRCAARPMARAQTCPRRCAAVKTRKHPPCRQPAGRRRGTAPAGQKRGRRCTAPAAPRGRGKAQPRATEHRPERCGEEGDLPASATASAAGLPGDRPAVSGKRGARQQRRSPEKGGQGKIRRASRDRRSTWQARQEGLSSTRDRAQHRRACLPASPRKSRRRRR
ncbi:MAG: hypothetical protein XXXNARYT_000372 [Candidatus Accumulibacter regalis]|jgi:hypothetical protein